MAVIHCLAILMLVGYAPATFLSVLTSSGQSGLRCNECSPYLSGKGFPQCLQKTQTCPSGHACTILYKPGVPMSSYLTMGCTTTCLNYQSSQSDRCVHGGTMTNFNTCVKCCKRNPCTDQFRDSATGKSTPTPTPQPTVDHSPLRCPGTCSANDLKTCESRATTCGKGTYCNIAMNQATGQLIGQCASVNVLSTCLVYTRDHHCPVNPDRAISYLLTHGNRRGYCYYGCCGDNSCVQDIMTPKPTTTLRPITTPTTTRKTTRATKPTTPKPTTQPPTPTTAIPTQSPADTYNYSALLTSCVDKLQGTTCSTLRDMKDICKAPVGATLCPVTCNVCQTVQSVVCEDKTTTIDCFSLSLNPLFCQDVNAIYVCPKSCNLCNKLVKSVVDEVLFASPTPDFNIALSTPPTLHCPELLQSDCSHVRDVCNHSNLHDICPKECKVCA